MLAEHGIYGAASALLMILMPFTYYFKFSKTPEQKTYLVAFVIFGLFTTMHAAMRLAVPGACYGLGFLILEPAKNALERKDG